MRMRLLAGLLWAALAAPVAASPEPENPYADGVEAARAGDFATALVHFEAARRSGLDTPALAYNLGVVHFRLGHLDAAYEAFLTLTPDSQWKALAHYNLGLIEERRNRPDAALRHFRRASATATSPKLRELAERKIQPRTSSADAAESRWQGVASVAGGYDDNVLLANDQLLDSVSNEGDFLSEFLAAARRPLSRGAARGPVLDVAGYYRAHSDLSDFDFGAISATLNWRTPGRDGHWGAGLRAEAQFAGGASYANLGTLRLEFARRYGSRWTFRSTNDVSYLAGGSDFDYVSGWRNRTRLQLTRAADQVRADVGYELELNDRDDLASERTFYSYSPHRHRFYGTARFPLTPRLDLELQGSVRFSRYPEDNRFLDESGTLVAARRDQDVLTLGARADYGIAPRWRVWSQYQFTESDSEISRYRYTSNRLLLGVETTF